jgi:glycosyltransferase involved in cell wall biosynthesis
LRYGSGVKGKIVASLEAGVPVVTTRIGNEGINLIHGTEALIGDTPRELAEHGLRLLRDPLLAERLATTGRSIARDRYSELRGRKDLSAALGLTRTARDSR